MMEKKEIAIESKLEENRNLKFSPFNSFKKSLSDNSQLLFSKKLTVSTLNPEDRIPYSEILDIEEIQDTATEGTKYNYLVCYVDNRTNFYKALKKNSIVHSIIYFPLSREKYKMNCLVVSFSGDEENITTKLTNQKQYANYASLNSKYTNCNDPLEYSSKCEDYLHGVQVYMKSLNSNKVLNLNWGKLSCEEKLDYESVDKDSVKIENKEGCELDKFESQEEVICSKNFAVLYLLPLDVEHCIYPMPQVVANSRRPNFESLMKPHKKPKKYFFIFDMKEAIWQFKELNI